MKSIINKGTFKKYLHSKFLIFDPLSPFCLPLFILHVPPPPLPPLFSQRTFVRMSYHTPFQKRFRDVYELSNEKSRSEKRKKN